VSVCAFRQRVDVNAVVVGIRDVERVAIGGHGNAARVLEIVAPCIVPVEDVQNGLRTTEDCHAVIVGIRNVDVAGRVHRDAFRLVEAGPLIQRCAVAAEYLDAVVVGVGHVNLAVSADGDAAQVVELAQRRALAVLDPQSSTNTGGSSSARSGAGWCIGMNSRLVAMSAAAALTRTAATCDARGRRNSLMGLSFRDVLELPDGGMKLPLHGEGGAASAILRVMPETGSIVPAFEAQVNSWRG